mmetsp:Transcript_43734/g.126327  ORF Transcript_43734/g.126327 Transcript_43734/m.126327 type:complete len:392 (-) Transcript_43734:167-1342(-)
MRQHGPRRPVSASPLGLQATAPRGRADLRAGGRSVATPVPSATMTAVGSAPAILQAPMATVLPRQRRFCAARELMERHRRRGRLRQDASKPAKAEAMAPPAAIVLGEAAPAPPPAAGGSCGGAPRRRQAAGRRRRSAKTSIPGAHLEHLMCFIGNSRLQNDLKVAEDMSAQQDQDVEEMHHARCQEVRALTFEAAALSLLGDGGGDLVACGGAARPRGAEGLPADFNGMISGAGAYGHAVGNEVVVLEQQADLHNELRQEYLKRVIEAREKTALLTARLAVLRESCGQEVKELRRQAQALAEQAEPATDSEVATRQRQGREVCRGLWRAGGRLLAALGQPPLDPQQPPAAASSLAWPALAERLQELASGLAVEVPSQAVSHLSTSASLQRD